jgi:hypothetical protein
MELYRIPGALTSKNAGQVYVNPEKEVTSTKEKGLFPIGRGKVSLRSDGPMNL